MGIYALSASTIEIWAKERAEQPFMSPEEFGAALEEIMNDDNKQDGER
jgi:MraZ protein